jgi:type II secretory pathway pseudopilin PulG
MANKNRRTAARREKERKEAQHKKVVEKPIYKRPWIWIALAALVLGITVPSVYQYSERVKEERVAAAAEAAAKAEAEPLVRESLTGPFEQLGITDSAIQDISYDLQASTTGGALDIAYTTITTDVRTIIAYSYFQEGTDATVTSDSALDEEATAALAEDTWVCAEIFNEDYTHIYWSSMSDGVSQAYVYDSSTGSYTLQPLYDYVTDEEIPTPETTDSAIDTTDSAIETTDSAVEADEGDEAASGEAPADESAADGTTSDAATESEDE